MKKYRVKADRLTVGPNCILGLSPGQSRPRSDRLLRLDDGSFKTTHPIIFRRGEEIEAGTLDKEVLKGLTEVSQEQE